MADNEDDQAKSLQYWDEDLEKVQKAWATYTELRVFAEENPYMEDEIEALYAEAEYHLAAAQDLVDFSDPNYHPRIISPRRSLIHTAFGYESEDSYDLDEGQRELRRLILRAETWIVNQKNEGVLHRKIQAKILADKNRERTRPEQEKSQSKVSNFLNHPWAIGIGTAAFGAILGLILLIIFT